LKIAVVAGIRVDQAPDRAAFRGNLGLDAAPRAAVSRYDDLFFHVDAELFQLLVVLGQSVVDINQGSSNVAIRRIDIEDRKLVLDDTRSRIFR
jgi:hypothetical protein